MSEAHTSVLLKRLSCGCGDDIPNVFGTLCHIHVDVALVIYCVPVSVRLQILHEGFLVFGFFRYAGVNYSRRCHNASTPMFSGGVQIEGYECRIVVSCLQGFDDGWYLDEAYETIDTVGIINLDELIVKLPQNLGGVVVIRILDFLGKTIEVYIREDISVNGIVKLVVIPSALFFEKLGLRQGSVMILSVCQSETSAVIEPAEDGSDVIDTSTVPLVPGGIGRGSSPILMSLMRVPMG